MLSCKIIGAVGAAFKFVPPSITKGIPPEVTAGIMVVEENSSVTSTT
jgi:hypothetical protein